MTQKEKQADGCYIIPIPIQDLEAAPRCQVDRLADDDAAVPTSRARVLAGLPPEPGRDRGPQVVRPQRPAGDG